MPRRNLNVSLWGLTGIIFFISRSFLGPVSTKEYLLAERSSRIKITGYFCVENLFKVPVKPKGGGGGLRNPKLNLSLIVGKLRG